MARRGEEKGGAGCLAVIVGVVLAFLAVAWSLSTVGHLLGLTPSYSEAFDRPDGWVGRHYRGVFWGYVLTVVAIVALAGLLWLAVRTRDADPVTAVKARMRLSDSLGPIALLAAAILFLPIGQRPGVDTSAGSAGAAKEGNVPDVVGMSAADAEATLEGATLRAELQDVPYTAPGRCRIVSQEPSPGSDLDEYETVELTCRSRVPRVVGMKAERAESRLSRTDFEVRYANEPDDYDFTRCRVLRQSRSGSAPPGVTIGLRLRCAEPPPPPASVPEPVASCDPAYDGACLDPNASDYDCAGGSGDGPEYTGPVVVVGYDRHGLDSDGDGYACE